MVRKGSRRWRRKQKQKPKRNVGKVLVDGVPLVDEDQRFKKEWAFLYRRWFKLSSSFQR